MVNKLKFILPFLLLLTAFHCGKTPMSLPSPETGVIQIVVEGASAGDSIRVVLDDQSVGKFKGQILLSEVVIGSHKLYVFIGAMATPPQTVEVRSGETTPVTFKITSGPYVGNKAPLFAVKDVKGDSISLSKQKGKVVLLVFFEHT
jgi:hypothetical protein